jgi:Leucine-rich repeat (LRR) protein
LSGDGVLNEENDDDKKARWRMARRWKNTEETEVERGSSSGIVPACRAMDAMGGIEVTRIHLANNQLKGQLPSFRRGTSSAAVSSSRQSVWQINDSLCIADSLRVVELNNNYLEGTIPHTIGDCSQLTELYLEANTLSGSIPSSLGDGCTALRALVLDSNNLGGAIPDSIGGLTALRELSAYDNKLSGPLPPLLFADHNKLNDGEPPQDSQAENGKHAKRGGNDSDDDEGGNDGDISQSKAGKIILNNSALEQPKRKFIQRQLRMVDLSGNALTGDLRHCGFGRHLHSLQYLDLSSNGLKGQIPVGIGECTALEHLSLADNVIMGSASELSVWRLTRLVHLDLSQNNFIGFLPRRLLGKLVQLRELRFHSNELMGKLPLDAFAMLRRKLTHVVLAPGNLFDGDSATRTAALQRLFLKSVLIRA